MPKTKKPIKQLKVVKKPVKEVKKSVEALGAEVEPKVEKIEIPKEYYGVNAIPVLKIESLLVRDLPVKDVYLADGTIERVSDEELNVRLDEGKRAKE